LAGEVRAVSQPEPRLAEAAKRGFTRVVLPAATARRLEMRRMEVLGVETLGQALAALFDAAPALPRAAASARGGRS
jgi:DNA repair protein RadA/Sms